MKRPVVLVILDGWGLCDETRCSAIARASTPVFQRLWDSNPHSTLQADGQAVGLMTGQMGDSNVGHLNMGAGRIVYQDLVRIFRAIDDGRFFSNEALLNAMRSARHHSLHLMGLLSDGGVHSHEKHLHALIRMARENRVSNVCVHCFLDGRDVPPKSALQYINTLELVLRDARVGRIATVMGRYYAMDRDRRWDRTQRAYDALVFGRGIRAQSAKEAVERAYDRGETDEFVAPAIVDKNGGGCEKSEPRDSVIFFNFRADRARQITRAFIDEDLEEVARPLGVFPLTYVGMAQYDETFEIPTAFGPLELGGTFGEVISKRGLRQLRLAETEKYAHVTFFFNGMVERPFQNEDRILIPSPKVSTYDLKPEMSAPEVAKAASDNIASGKYDCIIMNFANADMVGHTGNMDAAARAAAAVDRALGVVVEAIERVGGRALVVSDHGNAEKMMELDGRPHTAHTNNPVPCILVNGREEAVSLRDGVLGDIAPTLLDMLDVSKPPEMTCQSLIERNASVAGGLYS
ncbi:MAG: 2,3-bisphosphoglycerate-independent phosphoglycerate mutase [Bacillota bacterium]|nr:2,3-bisphosphoglycerate-independent phosphoglycerate mutase [Bacillota bacterium]